MFSMDPFSSAASLIGGLSANKANKKMAREQMAFQERMANTVHQRGVADLRAAGLNPRLSAMSAMGAPSPSGASAPQTDPITPALNSGMAAALNRETVTNLKEQNAVLQTQQTLNSANAAAAYSQAAKTGVDTAVKSKFLPAAKAIETVTGKALSSARGVADEYRSKGFKEMFLKATPSQGGGLRAIGGWLSNKAGF